MPTKINKSPLTLDPATAISLAIKGAKGGAEATKEYAAKVRQDLGIEEGRKGLFGGILKSDEFKDLSFGKKLGILGKGLGYNALSFPKSLASFSKSLTRSDRTSDALRSTTSKIRRRTKMSAARFLTSKLPSGRRGLTFPVSWLFVR